MSVAVLDLDALTDDHALAEHMETRFCDPVEGSQDGGYPGQSAWVGGHLVIAYVDVGGQDNEPELDVLPEGPLLEAAALFRKYWPAEKAAGWFEDTDLWALIRDIQKTAVRGLDHAVKTAIEKENS